MAQFRKKPVVIEAIQLSKKTFHEAVLFIGIERIQTSYIGTVTNNDVCWININTLEGCIEATEGDWIIKGVEGEFYPCKPSIFKKTYESLTASYEGELKTLNGVCGIGA